MKPSNETTHRDELGASEAPSRFAKRIVVDHRERPSDVPTALATQPNVRLTFHHLTLGDYRVDDTLIVERKTVTDFSRSVRDGRLFAQAYRLAQVTTARPRMILEGTRMTRPGAVLSRSALQGALITVTLVFGLPLLRSSGPEETAQLILYAADQLLRRPCRSPHSFGVHAKELSRQQNLLLQVIPEIGPVKARRLLDTFGSPFSIASATVTNLLSINGIGPSTAANIHRDFHGDS